MEHMGNNNDFEEISLRELIEVLLKGWRIIAIITIISLLVSGVANYFIIEPTYEAKTILMASFATDRLSAMQTRTDDVEGILDSISTYPVMNIQTYQEQIKNPKILQQTIYELGLDKLGISRNGLRGMIELETISNTNLIAIKVKGVDPELAANIANTVASKFTAFITDLARQQASKSSQFLKTQLEAEKKKLDEASLELKQFLSQPRGVDELQGEYSTSLALLTTYKTRLVQEEVELSKLKAGLATAEKEMEKTPKVLVTQKSVGQDPLLNQVVSDKNNASIAESAEINMRSEEINEQYIYLATKVSEYRVMVSETTETINIIKAQIDTTQKSLETIQAELAEKQHKQDLTQRRVDIAQQTYDAFMKKYEETRIAESTELGDSSINVVSQAAIPEVPVGPKKMLNLAIAGALGVMLGVFIAFFKEYWEKSAKQTVNN